MRLTGGCARRAPTSRNRREAAGDGDVAIAGGAELEPLAIRHTPLVTHLSYRVVRRAARSAVLADSREV